MVPCTGPLSLCKEVAKPNVYQALNVFSCFEILRTKKPFSNIKLDQRQEQHNNDVKEDAGFLDLTEDVEKLQCWMVGGPEVTHAVAEFELSCTLRKEETTDFRHHEQTPAF